MPFLTIGARRHPLAVAETTIGGARAALPLPWIADDAPLAVVVRDRDDRVTIRSLRAEPPILVDGCPLTAEPRMLAHGAKIELLGRTLLFGDSRRSAGTERVAGIADDRLSVLDAALPPESAADTGGRLVSLADGRVWVVPDTGLEIGRDPACDVVLASPDASRWHATIEPTLLGYVVRDASSNGIRVNGARVEESRHLAPGDVLRIGGEEFRFDADPAPRIEESAAPAAETPLRRAASVAVAPAAPPLLATLEIVNEGVRKGERIRIEHAPARIGRSSRLDLVFRDDSVSGTHATLERRDGAWFVVDHDSTNGTYVDGDRIRGEARLAGAAELRFGNVKVIFRPIAAASVTAPPNAPPDQSPGGDTAGTRGIVGV